MGRVKSMCEYVTDEIYRAYEDGNITRVKAEEELKPYLEEDRIKENLDGIDDLLGN